ncbi:hypothetical protein ACFZBU_42955 [Embleya sp. NPDC008237]|uniref:hypothetical protein n=1 Tax=Embleya sp. NPDC008237 TaxID=3363978 RepID=UPI0036E0A019
MTSVVVVMRTLLGVGSGVRSAVGGIRRAGGVAATPEGVPGPSVFEAVEGAPVAQVGGGDRVELAVADEEAEEQVVDGAHGLDVRRAVGRARHDPGGGDVDAAAVRGERGGDRPSEMSSYQPSSRVLLPTRATPIAGWIFASAMSLLMVVCGFLPRR